MDKYCRITARIDRGEILNVLARSEIKVDLVKNINWSKKRFIRAGIIPYIRDNDKIIFLFGQDAKYKALTDFGGSVRYSVDNVAILGAIREAIEESESIIFKHLSISKLENSIITYSEEMCVIFLEIKESPCQFIKDFERAKKIKQYIDENKRDEIDKVVYLSHYNLLLSLHDKGIYGIYIRLKDFFRDLLMSYPKFFNWL